MPLNINVQGKAAEKRSFEDLPEGWYHVIVSEVELKEVRELKPDGSKNPNAGKPMYNFEFQVTDDPRNPQDADGASKFAGRRFFTNACLWSEAFYTMADIMRAVGLEVQPGVVAVPDITDDNEREQLVGQELMLRWTATRKERTAATKEKRAPEASVNAFKPADEEDDGPASTATAVPATTRRRVL